MASMYTSSNQYPSPTAAATNCATATATAAAIGSTADDAAGGTAGELVVRHRPASARPDAQRRAIRDCTSPSCT